MFLRVLFLLLTLSPASWAASFLDSCKNPGQDAAIDITVEALKYYAKHDDCVEADRKLRKATWIELDHPDLTDLRVLNDFPKVRSLLLLSDEAVRLDQLTGLRELRSLSVFAPITEMNYPGQGLERLQIDRAIDLRIAPSVGLAALQTFILSDSTIAKPNNKPDTRAQGSGLDALRRATQLHKVQINHCELQDLSWLTPLRKVAKLFLDGNAIEDVSAISHLPALTDLALSDNPITDISSLAPLAATVRNLRLSRLALKDTSTLAAFGDVEVLSVGGLGLTDFEFLGDCPNLISLSAGDNNLGQSPNAIDTLSRCSHLQYVYLHDSGIKSFLSLADLTSLKNLDLSGNQLTTVGLLPRTLFDFDLSDNPLTSLEFMANQPLPSLYRLKIKNTAVVSLKGIGSATGLSELIADDSKLRSLAGIEGLRGLRQLSTDFAFIEDLQPLAQLRSLRSLSLLGNKITDASPLADLQKLVQLDLYSNPLGDSIAKTAANCPIDSANALLNEWCQE